jgi:hypothetical protein
MFDSETLDSPTQTERQFCIQKNNYGNTLTEELRYFKKKLQCQKGLNK